MLRSSYRRGSSPVACSFFWGGGRFYTAWVKLRPRPDSQACPVYPREPTLSGSGLFGATNRHRRQTAFDWDNDQRQGSLFAWPPARTQRAFSYHRGPFPPDGVRRLAKGRGTMQMRPIVPPLQVGEGSSGNQSAPTPRRGDLHRRTGRCLTDPKLRARRSVVEGRPVTA
jgi:hypothetical protein